MVILKHPPGKGKNRDQYNGKSVRVAASGTIVGASGAVLAGGGTLILTVSQGIWLQEDIGFANQRQGIIDGISGTGDIATAVAELGVEDVVRTSDRVVTITFPASSYSIAEAETVTVAVPAAAFYLTDTPRVTTRDTSFSISVPVAGDEGPLYAGTITAEGPSILVSWVDVANLAADDGANATCDLSSVVSNSGSKTVALSDFGFAIPAGATINGIIVEVERFRTDGGGALEDALVQLTKSTPVAVGNNKADMVTAWPTSAATVTYGASDDLWGATWTAAEVNDPGFGVLFRVIDSSDLDTANVDFVRMTVHYTE